LAQNKAAEDDEGMILAADSLKNEQIPKFLDLAEYTRKKHGGGQFIVGDSMTYADVCVADVLMRLRDDDDFVRERHIRVAYMTLFFVI